MPRSKRSKTEDELEEDESIVVGGEDVAALIKASEGVLDKKKLSSMHSKNPKKFDYLVKHLEQVEEHGYDEVSSIYDQQRKEKKAYEKSLIHGQRGYMSDLDSDPDYDLEGKIERRLHGDESSDDDDSSLAGEVDW